MSTRQTAKDELTAYGYIRENLDENRWIDEIVVIIIQFYLNQGGSLYVFGNGECGRLGIKKYEKGTCFEPTLCPPFIDNNAQKISVSDCHSLILDVDGNVWCCGTNRAGELGLGKNVNGTNVPTKLNLGTRIISISTGRDHSLFLSCDGWVYASGFNEFGQLGLGKINIRSIYSYTPKMIEGLKNFNIIQISAGNQHSAALTKDGVLFCFGNNEFGQCGVGHDSGKTIISPKMVQMNDKIDFIECSQPHSLLITEKRLIYSFGGAIMGCLGHVKSEEWQGEDCYVPKIIETLKEQRMTTCAAGRAHSICINDEGMVWAFGLNNWGQCGVDSWSRQSIPIVIEYFASNKIKAMECAADSHQSCVISDDRSLYVFGCNQEFQLGLKEALSAAMKIDIPQKLCLPDNASVQSVSLGPHHGAVICNH